MTLVLQCAMCGTHQPVGTPACTSCRASGVGPLRLMFECPGCGRLDISPICGACPLVAGPFDWPYDADGLVIAEEVVEDPFAAELDEADAVLIVDLSEVSDVLELDAEEPAECGKEV